MTFMFQPSSGPGLRQPCHIQLLRAAVLSRWESDFTSSVILNIAVNELPCFLFRLTLFEGFFFLLQIFDKRVHLEQLNKHYLTSLCVFKNGQKYARLDCFRICFARFYYASACECEFLLVLT